MLSKAYACGRSIAGIAGSNPAEGMDVVLVFAVCCIDNGLRDELITRSGEFNRVFVHNCV